MKKLQKNKKGFTLIEIIVVLIIMGILLAIAAPAILSYVGRAEDQRDLMTARAGFLGAQTIVLEERAADPDATDADLAAAITVADINTELGAGTTINAIFCEVTTKTVTQCSIQVEDEGDWANYVANGTAEMAKDATIKVPTPAKPTQKP